MHSQDNGMPRGQDAHGGAEDGQPRAVVDPRRPARARDLHQLAHVEVGQVAQDVGHPPLLPDGAPGEEHWIVATKVE